MKKVIGVLCLAVSLSASLGQAAEGRRGAKPYAGNRLDEVHGRKVYDASCAACHNSGEGGAPRLQQADAWKTRSFRAFSVLNSHAKNGFLRMPAKGSDPKLSQQDIADAVFFMTQQLQTGPAQ